MDALEHHKVKEVISIKEGKIHFKGVPASEIGMSRYCEPFVLDISKVKIIALSPHLTSDEDYVYVQFVDRNGKAFLVPEEVFNLEGMRLVEENFELEPLLSACEKYRPIQYARFFTDKIIYPPALYWEDLYKKIGFGS